MCCFVHMVFRLALCVFDFPSLIGWDKGWSFLPAHECKKCTEICFQTNVHSWLIGYFVAEKTTTFGQYIERICDFSTVIRSVRLFVFFFSHVFICTCVFRSVQFCLIRRDHINRKNSSYNANEQANEWATGSIVQISRYHAENLFSLRSFYANVGFYDFIRHILPKITLSKQITDTFISIYTHPFAGSSMFTVRIAHMIQMNDEPTSTTCSSWACTQTECVRVLCVPFTPFIFTELRTHKILEAHFLLRPMSSILRVILSCALHLVRKLMVLL